MTPKRSQQPRPVETAPCYYCGAPIRIWKVRCSQCKTPSRWEPTVIVRDEQLLAEMDHRLKSMLRTTSELCAAASAEVANCVGGGSACSSDAVHWGLSALQQLAGVDAMLKHMLVRHRDSGHRDVSLVYSDVNGVWMRLLELRNAAFGMKLTQVHATLAAAVNSLTLPMSVTSDINTAAAHLKLNRALL